MTAKPTHHSGFIDSMHSHDVLIENLQMPRYVKQPFELADISYLMLPIVQFILMILISSLVSLMTGGRRQRVPEGLTVDWIHRKEDWRRAIEPPKVTMITDKLRSQIIVAHFTSDKDKNNMGLGKIIVDSINNGNPKRQY